MSLNALDNAIYGANLAKDSIQIAEKQYLSDLALLDKYVVKSPIDGTILRIASTVGDYATTSGTYETYTQGFIPTITMGIVTPYLQVRAYLDEILVPKLPEPTKFKAKLFIRGMNNKSIDLEFSYIQPYTISNIELSDQRNERVDVRVLPIVFKFKKPTDIRMYPGQLVDVYIAGKV